MGSPSRRGGDEPPASAPLVSSVRANILLTVSAFGVFHFLFLLFQLEASQLIPLEPKSHAANSGALTSHTTNQGLIRQAL